MIEATRLTLSVLDELGLQAFLKTSGGKGMHVVVPLARSEGWDITKAFAKAISLFMTRQMPQRITATMGPKNRVGKIFVDYLRNARGASTVSAYSVRARPGLPVSVPIARAELDGLRNAQQWDIYTALERARNLGADPWEGYNHRQRITARMWEQLDAQKPGE
jgi:bifunctional non-homologous end joining protein LigD